MDSTFSVLPAYAELFAFSNFTFLHGASRGEELVMRAAQLGYSGLAITDERGGVENSDSSLSGKAGA